MLAACGGGSTDDSIKVTGINPAFGPLAGGTHVVITGSGFLRDGAPPNHVVVGDTDAPLAAATDDQTLEVEIPPGKKAGDAPITIFNRNGIATTMGMFHYSSEPTITAVTPPEILWNVGGTVTVTGMGFQDENAGPATVTVDGQPQVDVMVTSDTTLTFSVQPGAPLSRPEIDVTNTRGTGTRVDAFRYAPSVNACFLIFTNNDPANFMYIFDPTANTTLAVKNVAGTPTGYRAVYEDTNGDYWAIGNRFSGDNKFGKIDFKAQALINPITLSGRITSLARMGSTVYAVDRNPEALGTFDPKTGLYTQIGANGSMTCCSPGLAVNTTNGNLYYIGGGTISTVNPANGQRGTATTMTPAKHTDELKVMNNVIYGLTTSGEIFSVDPTTGATTTVTNLGFGTRSIASFEIYTPGAVQ